jgi:cytochrome c biogenesis protein CcdA/thiol-disulfide isomerase/thioredoxin
MLLVVVTYLAGILTIFSPCILPVLPFVFSKSQGSFLKSGLPLLAGMALTFSLFSAVAIVGGEWVGRTNEVGRTVAMILLTLFGISLIFPHIAEAALTPLTRLGAKIGKDSRGDSPGNSLLVGVSTGLLWAPCAGPILGLVLTGAASRGNVGSSVGLLLSYSLGAATSLALALFAGNRFFNTLKKVLGVDRYVKVGLGIAVLLGVFTIAFNLDRTVLTRISKVGTESIENQLLSIARPQMKEKSEEKPRSSMMMMMAPETNSGPVIEGVIPELDGITTWLNTKPLSITDLRGHVVLIDFWTYSCINCLRTLPYVKSWAEKYKNDGFIVIGVHTPEFAFEKIQGNVERAAKELDVNYPVAIDSDYKIWNAFKNQYWPAHYFVDRLGRIRHHHFGEGKYDESEEMIRKLLSENGSAIQAAASQAGGQGVQAAATTTFQSPETYVGYSRADNFAGNQEIAQDKSASYSLSNSLELNQWALGGRWLIEKDRAVSKNSKAKIAFRFHARDLHLVLGSNGKSIPFRVTIDDHPPQEDHGLDISANGDGQVTEHRLYQLIRQKEDGREIQEHTFSIEFSSPDVEVYAFTFG